MSGHKLDLADGATGHGGKVSLGEAMGHIKGHGGIGADGVAKHILAPGDPLTGRRGFGTLPVDGHIVAFHSGGNIGGRIVGRVDLSGHGAGGS